MKVKYKKIPFYLFLFLIFALSNCEQDSSRSKDSKSQTITNSEVTKNSQQGYVIPQTIMHVDDSMVYNNRMGFTQNRFVQNVPMNSLPVIHNQRQTSYLAPPNLAPFCGCASEVRCKPCNGIVEPNVDMFSNPNCPCAPPISCPKCPPISLIHEIASRKVNIFLIIDK